MERLKQPIWLLVSFTSPLLLLFVLFNETFEIIESLLTTIQSEMWTALGYYALGLITLSAIAFGYLQSKKQPLGKEVAWVMLVLGIINIASYFFFIDEFLPRSIPNWMFSAQDLEIFPYSFLIPSVLYSIILLAIKYTPNPQNHKAFLNLIPVVVIPLSIFAIGSGISIFFRNNSRNFFLFEFLPISLLVFFTCLFIFFLIRFIYILSVKNERRNVVFIVVKVLFTCLFPVLGLYFNNKFDVYSGGIFGDFSHPIFYILSILNGIVLCLPETQNVVFRWIQFIVKSILFTFILYFFSVFIPFLPLSILAIIAAGFGFLMLAPIIVFIYQLQSIANGISFLKTKANSAIIYSVLSICILVLPISITVDYKTDRNELDKIFSYLYDRSYSDKNEYQFNEERIHALLTHIRAVKTTRIKHKPFLDSYYNWVVLDNLLLSDEKLDEISAVFTGEKLEKKQKLWSWFSFPERKAEIENITTESNFNDRHWTSTVKLEVSNKHERDIEFLLYFETPDDCFISNYYLEIEGKKEFGILAETKSASWVYNNIVKQRRDPGLLTYVGNNKYSLRVFPVQNTENRITGIEFVHKNPIKITLNDTIVQLGEPQNAITNQVNTNNGNVLYIPAEEKENLPKAFRQSDYHILIDKSVNNNLSIDSIQTLVKYIENSVKNPKDIKLWSVNYEAKSLNAENWFKQLESEEAKGGFYPEYLMKKIIYESYENENSKAPIFISITSNVDRISILKGFSELLFAVPDLPYFYSINTIHHVLQFDLESGKNAGMVHIVDIAPDATIPITWKDKTYHLQDNLKASYISSSADEKPNNKWEEGVLLNKQLNNYALHPEKKDTWNEIVKKSIGYNILSPFTAFLSLENDAQKKALLKKQKEVLNADKNFDLEEVVPMSEPSVIWYLLALLVRGCFVKRPKLW